MIRIFSKRMFPIAVLLFLTVAVCSRNRQPSPASSETSGKEAGGTGGQVAAASSGGPSECRRCELASRNANCAAGFLTAKRDASGNPVDDTFGCGTLVSLVAQAACNALLSCINKNRCSINPVTKAAPGDNPVLGCYCGMKTASTDCLTGRGINGPCLSQYHAAATATAGGPAAAAGVPAFAAFISPRAFDATTAFGLADNIATCAADAPCPACNGL